MFDVKPFTSPKPLDCGATCLQMLLDYYGIEADLETLTTECNTDITGCAGRDLLRVGRTYGLDMHAYKIDAEELVNQDRPAIVWWRGDHFCIMAGRDEDGKVVICNPDKGRYRMSFGTFKSFATIRTESNPEGMPIAFFNGEPVDLPAPPAPVTLTEEQAQEYADLREIADKLEEVFF